jgi:phosphoribosylformimino-5-aminoimidazole carboxamide ribotide isomerase
MMLIPAIDLRAGHCVRLLHGDFEAETRYPVEPRALAAKYQILGADWLHIVDLDGARGDLRDNRAAILDLADRQTINLQVGGGLRDAAALQQILDAGVARAVLGSAAITQVPQVQAWLQRFGAERLALAFDVCMDDAGVPRVMTHGWQQQSAKSLWEAVDAFAASPLKHVLCTDVGRDGALTGPNIGLYREAMQRYPRIAWQASGGIRNAHDLHLLAETGAAAAISGKALLEDLIPKEELQPFLRNA